MFCPKCAAQNVEQASFCRGCGANISLVPQALSGQLPSAADSCGAARRVRKRPEREPGLEAAIPTFFTGIAFLVVSVALGLSQIGYGWWFWMLIPAFSCMGSGIAQYFKYREARKRFVQPIGIQSSLDSTPMPASLPKRHTGEMLQPPASVTEGTTRHLGAEVPTRQLDS